MKSIDLMTSSRCETDFHGRDWETLLASFLTALVIVGVLLWSGSALKIRPNETPMSVMHEAEITAKA